MNYFEEYEFFKNLVGLKVNYSGRFFKVVRTRYDYNWRQWVVDLRSHGIIGLIIYVSNKERFLDNYKIYQPVETLSQ